MHASYTPTNPAYIHLSNSEPKGLMLRVALFSTGHQLSRLHPLLQTIPDALPDPLLEFLRIVTPQPSGLHVGWALVVRRRKHGDDGEEDGFGGLNWRPTLCGRFVAVFVITWRVEDRDADFAVGVDCAFCQLCSRNRALDPRIHPICSCVMRLLALPQCFCYGSF